MSRCIKRISRPGGSRRARPRRRVDPHHADTAYREAQPGQARDAAVCQPRRSDRPQAFRQKRTCGGWRAGLHGEYVASIPARPTTVRVLRGHSRRLQRAWGSRSASRRTRDPWDVPTGCRTPGFSSPCLEQQPRPAAVSASGAVFHAVLHTALPFALPFAFAAARHAALHASHLASLSSPRSRSRFRFTLAAHPRGMSPAAHVAYATTARP